MIAVVQRVTESSVSVEGRVVGEIGKGLTILLGVRQGDTPAQARLLAGKIARLRIFCDERDKMNLSVTDIDGSALVISQFTLCADTKKGNRPSFTDSADPETAERLYMLFVEHLREHGIAEVQTGVFAAKMDVAIRNDGPVTIVLDTAIWTKQELT